MFLGLRLIQGIAGAFGIVISRAIARDVARGPELLQFYSILIDGQWVGAYCGTSHWRADTPLYIMAWYLCRYGRSRRSDVPVNHSVSGNASTTEPYI